MQRSEFDFDVITGPAAPPVRKPTPHPAGPAGEPSPQRSQEPPADTKRVTPA